METHLKLQQVLKLPFFSCLVHRLVEIRLNYLYFGSPRLLRSLGMSSSLALLCNPQLFVLDISYSYLYSQDLYLMVSDVYFLVSLHCYYMLCMIRQLALVHQYPLQYLNVCSSMMSVHPKGGGSTWDTRVSLIYLDMVFGLIKCYWMSPFPTVCRGSLRVVQPILCHPNPSHSFRGGVGGS